MLSARDIGTIEEALRDSAWYWQSLVDRNINQTRICTSLCDPRYERKISGLNRERGRLERIVKRRKVVLDRLRKAKEAGKIC